MEQNVFEPHDHKTCISTSMDSVEAACEERGLQLTKVRRRVLEILLKDHQAMGAYQVLDVLREEGLGSQPPVAYRALDFLVKNGFAHKIESKNAFVACSMPHEEHMPSFLICQNCDAVSEARGGPALRPISRVIAESGFQVENAMIEVNGLCQACVPQEPEVTVTG